MRDFTFNLDSNEFIRITGYLVRKSDLVDIDTKGALHSSDYLAAGSESVVSPDPARSEEDRMP